MRKLLEFFGSVVGNDAENDSDWGCTNEWMITRAVVKAEKGQLGEVKRRALRNKMK